MLLYYYDVWYVWVANSIGALGGGGGTLWEGGGGRQSVVRNRPPRAGILNCITQCTGNSLLNTDWHQPGQTTELCSERQCIDIQLVRCKAVPRHVCAFTYTRLFLCLILATVRRRIDFFLRAIRAGRRSAAQ